MPTQRLTLVTESTPDPDEGTKSIVRQLWPELANDLVALKLRQLADEIEDAEVMTGQPRGVIVVAVGDGQGEVLSAGYLCQNDFERAGQWLIKNLDRLNTNHQGGESP